MARPGNQPQMTEVTVFRHAAAALAAAGGQRATTANMMATTTTTTISIITPGELRKLADGYEGWSYLVQQTGS
jgi:hypothetical protein